MNARHAQTLQEHALDSLEELRTWLSSREADLAPALAGAPELADGAADSAVLAAYAAWGAHVEAAMRVMGKAFPECERRPSPPSGPLEPDVDSVPPTLPSGGMGHSGWLPPPSSRAPRSASVLPLSSSRS